MSKEVHWYWMCVPQVSPDTLSPAWGECLLFDRVLLEGTMEDLVQDPPLVIIHIFDYDAVVIPARLPSPSGEAMELSDCHNVQENVCRVARSLWAEHTPSPS